MQLSTLLTPDVFNGIFDFFKIGLGMLAVGAFFGMILSALRTPNKSGK